MQNKQNMTLSHAYHHFGEDDLAPMPGVPAVWAQPQKINLREPAEPTYNPMRDFFTRTNRAFAAPRVMLPPDALRGRAANNAAIAGVWDE